MEAYINYFAYGSNMDEKQMMQRCKNAEFVDSARLLGHKFIINSRGVATIVSKSDSEVYGILWRITKQDEEKLDRCEGIEHNVYRKEKVSVTTYKGKHVEVMVYIATNSTPGSPRHDYMERIVAAARLHNFPDNYIKELESWLIKQ
jgi:gamma-glutamylcyclotransferase (GGCT)/AIG2-like uncharacterized protein YtfP